MWTNLSDNRPAQSPKPATPSRADLKRNLALCDEAARQVKGLEGDILSIERELDKAAELHEAAAREIHAKLEGTTDPAARQSLRSELHVLNEALDTKCKSLRAQIPPLQQQSIEIIRDAPNRARTERQLIETASLELQRQYWRAQRNTSWAEQRRHAARRELADATELASSAVSFWQFESAECENEYQASLLESDALRAELLSK